MPKKTTKAIWLDSNIFVHAQLRDAHNEACRKVLAALEAGSIEGWVDATVLREVSYVLTRRFGWSRQDTAEYLLLILSAPGVRTVHPQEALERAVTWWMRSDKAFVDCLLAALAKDQGGTVCSVDVDDILALGGQAATPEQIIGATLRAAHSRPAGPGEAARGRSGSQSAEVDGPQW